MKNQMLVQQEVVMVNKSMGTTLATYPPECSKNTNRKKKKNTF